MIQSERRSAMRVFRLLPFVSLLFLNGSLATTIEFEAVDLQNNLWQYNYFVSGRTFSADQDFTIFFDYHRYGQLQSPPPAINSDWSVIVLQPDLKLPDNGAYDALALVDGASLADPFRVGFLFLGPGTPGSQPFTIDQFDAAGNLLQVLETGNTIPRQQSPVPEPSSLLLCLVGLRALLYRTARR
jgi:hypothetical protein